MKKSTTSLVHAGAARGDSGPVDFVSGERKPRRFRSLADAGQALLRAGVIDPRAI